MESPAIHNEREYRAALARAEVLMDARPGTPEAEELLALVERIGTYERQHYPIAPPTPEQALTFKADQLGYRLEKVAAVRGEQRVTFTRSLEYGERWRSEPMPIRVKTTRSGQITIVSAKDERAADSAVGRVLKNPRRSPVSVARKKVAARKKK